MSAAIEAAYASASACTWWWIALLGAALIGAFKYGPSWIKLWWDWRDRASKAVSIEPTISVEDASYQDNRSDWLFVRMSIRNNASYPIKIEKVELTAPRGVVFKPTNTHTKPNLDWPHSWIEVGVVVKPREVQETHWFVGSTLRSMPQSQVSIRIQYREISPTMRPNSITRTSNPIDVPHITINKTS